MNIDNIDLRDNKLTDVERCEILLELSREMADDLIHIGAEPPDISYFMAYVATELGLAVTNNSPMVYPRILDALRTAGRNAWQARKCEAEPGPKKATQIDDFPENVIPIR
jgi:hypothetical protein